MLEIFEILCLLFKMLGLIAGCLLLLVMIWAIISVPIEKIFRRKKLYDVSTRYHFIVGE